MPGATCRSCSRTRTRRCIPRMTVGDIVAEPLLVHGMSTRRTATRTVDELLELVQLGAMQLDRLSARVLRRAATAHRHRPRARPVARSLVLDEPVSALDVSIQAEIIRLLRRPAATARPGLSVHRPRPVRRAPPQPPRRRDVSRQDRRGRLRSTSSTAARRTPTRKALLSAAPIPDPLIERDRARIVLVGDPPTPTNPPSGCRFRTRCWQAEASAPRSSRRWSTSPPATPSPATSTCGAESAENASKSRNIRRAPNIS